MLFSNIIDCDGDVPQEQVCEAIANVFKVLAAKCNNTATQPKVTKTPVEVPLPYEYEIGCYVAVIKDHWIHIVHQHGY